METVWTGNIRGLVNMVGASDARQTFVDSKTGAKISINIDGLDGATEQDEPFYIGHDDNLYDAYNRKEAVMILSNIRKGKRFPDMPDEPRPRKQYSVSSKSRGKSRSGGSSSLGTIRQ